MASSLRKPVIRIKPGKLHRQATAGEKALILGGAPFYVRGAAIVRPVSDELTAAHGRTTKVHRLVKVDVDTMIDYLSRTAIWERYDHRKGEWIPADPPRKVAATILARDGEWRFPRIVGVINTPTLRPDGSLLSKAGYDQATRLLLIDPPTMPSIPDRPTKEDAMAAVEILAELLNEFPFAERASRSVALSALISPVIRGALPAVPLHAITAPVAGSGKSYIVDLASAISTGQPAPVLSAGKNEEETSKRIAAALLDGQPIISIDNVNGELGGDLLCQAVERPVVALRPLGYSELVKVESRATWFATGNNIQLVGDMTRRTIQCSLDPAIERPELRHFRADPLQLVLERRGKYIAAALTVVGAYLEAGCPDPMPPVASFEGWNRLVRSALVWLGMEDPLLTMEKARQQDPATSELRALLRTLHSSIGNEGHTTGDIVQLARDLISQNGSDHDLYQALLMVSAGRSGEPDSRKLGRYLTRVRGRVVDGLKVHEFDDTHAKQKLWSIREA